MALDDRDIFMAICNRFTDQPIEFVMAQYAKAKRMNMEIERLTTWDMDDDLEPEEEEVATEVETVEIPAPPKKKLTKRQFVIKPDNSITEDAIFCCICGEQRQSLTAKHLAKHGVTVEEYKKVCGFPPNQPLMSGKRLAKSKEIIERAQKARLEKRKKEESD